MSRSRRACLARLLEMDSALARMERELPADVVSIGRDARRKVALWRKRLASGEAELSGLSATLREISLMMDALTARLLLAPWDGPKRTRLKS